MSELIFSEVKAGGSPPPIIDSPPPLLEELAQSGDWAVSPAMLETTQLPTATDVKDIKLLGAGGQGEVYRITLNNGNDVVMKLVKQDRGILDYGYPTNEIIISCSYRHRNFMRGLGVAPAGNYSRALANRGLGTILARYDSDLMTFMTAAATAPEYLANRPAALLDFIHGYRAIRELGLMHGDIKPQNALVRRDPFRVVLSDFGTCRPVPRSGDRRIGEAMGTLPFMPPEAKTSDGRAIISSLIYYDEPFDMYSIGVSLAYMVMADQPGLPAEFLDVAAQAVAGLKSPQATRWSLARLLESNFYTFLLKLAPHRRYVSPRMRQHISVAPRNQGDVLYLRACYDALSAEIKAEATRIRALPETTAGLVLLKRTPADVIAYAQVLAWCLLPWRSQITVSPAVLAKVLFWLGYKMVQSSDLPSNWVVELGSGIDQRVLLDAESSVLTIIATRMTVNCLIDQSASQAEMLSLFNLNDVVARKMTDLFKLNVISKFPLSFDQRDTSLVNVA